MRGIKIPTSVKVVFVYVISTDVNDERSLVSSD